MSAGRILTGTAIVAACGLAGTFGAGLATFGLMVALFFIAEPTILNRMDLDEVLAWSVVLGAIPAIVLAALGAVFGLGLGCLLAYWTLFRQTV